MFRGQKVTALLLAAGSGTRFGADGNKVYVQACGQPLLQYSLDVLLGNAYVDEVVLVVRDGEQELAETIERAELLLKFNRNRTDSPDGEGGQGESKPVTYTIGGATRAESVRRGLAASNGEIVLIHDGARPMIRNSFVTHCVEAMADFPGATMAVRSKDTIKLGDERDVVTATTERSHTWVVQTPQCFRREALMEAHEKYGKDPGITDDCMLLELCGQDVKLVEGDYTNIKVTTPEDLTLAEAFLRREGKRAGY